MLMFVVVTVKRSLKKKNSKSNSTKNRSKCIRRRFKHISEWRQVSVMIERVIV